jgi:purine catabolism regulator
MKLGELLDHAPLGLQLRTGDRSTRTRALAGAHAIEMAPQAQFVPPGWAMLTLGMTLRNRPAAQRQLVATLDDSGVSALGFGTGVTFRHVPPALIAEAEQRNFPVFEVPYETPYRKIIGYVNGCLLSDDLRAMHRLTSLQQHLMDALRDHEPEARLLERLGAAVGATAVLFDGDGKLLAASGPVAADAVWQRLEGDRPSLAQALTDEHDLVSVPVSVEGQRTRWLAVVRRERSIPAALAASLIRCTEQLLGLTMISHQSAADHERSLRAELLRSALEAAPSSEMPGRLAHFGIRLDGSARMYVFDVAPAGSRALPAGSAEQLRNRVERVLDGARTAHLMAVGAGEVLCLTPEPHEHVRAWAADLAVEGGVVTVAGGRPVTSLELVAESLRDARLALRVSGRPGEVVMFEDASLVSWLIGVAPADALTAKVDALLDPLRGHPQLYESLRVYLHEGASVPAAAAALNLHPNSLRYRIGRIEEVLGRSVSDLSMLAELRLAFLAEDLEPSAAGRPGTGTGVRAQP